MFFCLLIFRWLLMPVADWDYNIAEISLICDLFLSNAFLIRIEFFVEIIFSFFNIL